MISIHLNTSSLLAQRQLGVAHSSIATSLERLSTGFKINRAADNAANLAISKGQSCQISGTTVAQENTSQAINLLDTADGTLSKMQDIAGRIRTLSLQAMNGTYSDSERAMMQKEVEQLTQELYSQKNSTRFSDIAVFGRAEVVPESLDAIATKKLPVKGATGAVGLSDTVGTYSVDKLSEEEAIAKGYTVIKTAAQLKAIPANTTDKYILMDDIDMSGITNNPKAFSGEFNGNGYTITGLTSNLFAQNNGTIKNIHLKNVDIVKTNPYIGALATNNYGTIENCSAEGSVSAQNIIIGGLVGRNFAEGVITNCSFTGSVSNTKAHTGGLVGNNSGIVQNSVTSVTIESGADYAGGITAYGSGVIRNCATTANITSTGSSVGGITGYTSGEVLNCTATATITASGAAGGLIGNTSQTAVVKSSSATGKVSGTSNVGGLVGNCARAIISNCTASTNVVASSANSGGLVGVNSGNISNCEATGNIETNADYAGGLCGNNSGVISSSIASGNVKGTKNYYGGLSGKNSGSITNSLSQGNVEGAVTIGGFVSSNTGTITTSGATGNVSGSSSVAGFVYQNSSGGLIDECYANGDVVSQGARSGGFVGGNSATIKNSYATGNVTGTEDIGGFAGINQAVIENAYATGDVNGMLKAGNFVGTNYSGASISNSYSTGTITVSNPDYAQSTFVGNTKQQGALTNCYTNTEQPSNIQIIDDKVNYKSSQWFKDSAHLTFLGDSYDYYYSPPDLLNNPTEHKDLFQQFQVGANSGENNMLSIDLIFRLDEYFGDVASFENATKTLKRTDSLIDRISQKRSEIGATRNKLDSVMQSQAIKLENLSSSHSTMMDTDFASETAKLTRQQILQQATSSLLSQANMQPNIALRLLGG